MHFFQQARDRLILSSSAIAICAIPAQAIADCTPDPSVTYATTLCSGTDSDGLVVSTMGTSVQIQAGAIVQPGSGTASIILASNNGLTVDGLVQGGAVDGLRVTNGAPYQTYVPYDPYAGTSPDYNAPSGYVTIYPGASVFLSVGSAGVLTGNAAIRLQQRPDNASGQIYASIQNDGTIIGTAGTAIVAENGTTITNLYNLTGGTIGGISGAVQYLSNAGSIDGGPSSAVNGLGSGNISNFNGGALISEGSAPTLAINAGTVDNSGEIANSGSGAAISASGALTIYNRAPGVISTGGVTAITASDQLYLINSGEIRGAIDARQATVAATVDTTGGKIIGDILLGSGNDVLRGGVLDIASGTFSNITGTVDGGSGVDTVDVSIGADVTLNAITLPTNFEKFQLTLSNNAAITLGQELDMGLGLSASGSGTIITDRDMASIGSAISTGWPYASNVGFVNTGAITATLGTGTDFAVVAGQVSTSSNSGSITGVGGGGVGIATVGTSDSAFTNTGSITAESVAVQIRGRIDNSGTIRSTSGIGVSVQNGYFASTNSGTIDGATAGLRLDTSKFINTSVISATTGIGVDLGNLSLFDNRAGGIVNGATAAIGMSTFGYGAIVRNAGTLNGDVNFISQQGFDSSGDIFIDDGGIVNGDLRLGAGDDILVTDLGRAGSLAGVTGMIDAGSGYDVIRYQVDADSASVLSVPAGFEGLGYELTNGAKLVLASSGVQTLSVGFSGQGSIDLNADLAQADRVVIDLNVSNIAQLTGIGVSTPSDLTVVSRGNLSLTSGSFYNYGLGAVQAATASFENAGIISVKGAASSYYLPSAVFGGKLVTNSGTIRLDGAMAVNNAVKFINTGAVEQVAGGAASQGVVANIVQNSGTIFVDGNAVTTGYNYSETVVSNSGVITARNGIAILASGGLITNVAGGMISGSVAAIQSDPGGTVVNAGQINGDVRLGSSYYYSGQGKYVADGGALNGNLTFGSANDIVLTADGLTGVSGVIDAGAGIDLFGRYYRGDATTSIGGVLPTTFENELIESIGASTTVTLTDFGSPVTADVVVAGDGQIINQSVMASRLTAIAEGSVATDSVGIVAKFTNKGTLAGGFSGVTKSFVNEAMIGSQSLAVPAVQLSGLGDMDFGNSGTISVANSMDAVQININDANRLSFANSGTIGGSVVLSEGYSWTGEGFQTANITNSGHISTTAGLSALSMVVNAHATPSDLAITNSGMIENAAVGGAALRLDMNYGTGTSPSVTIDNNGTIRETSAGFGPTAVPVFLSYASQPSAAILLTGSGSGDPIIVTNRLGGLIEATQYNSAAILSYQPAVIIDNAGTISGSAGTDWAQTLYTNIGYRIDLEYHLAGAIKTGNLDDIVRNSGTIIGSVDLGGGDDILENRGTLTGNIFLGDGNDRLVTALGNAFTGTADGGNGSDTLIFDITGGGTLDATLYDRFVNFENFGLTGQGAIALQGLLPVQTLLLEDARFELQAGSVLQTLGPVALTGTSGDDIVINRGTIVGDVLLGDGNDQYTTYYGSSTSGIIDGGAGNDRLDLYFESSATGSTLINFAHYANFEQLDIEGGTGSYVGFATFDRVDVDSGRLIGLAGSTLNTSQGVTVAPGATFGSAGTVNGSLMVGGTLSPGASPGTMTVNGNVTLAGGSTTLFEMTPTISDALVITGNLAIQNGATFIVTGSRPLTPGLTYDLITASDGITGTFSAIAKSSSVLGYIRQTSSAVQLLGLLQVRTGTNTQVRAVTDYFNGLLASGLSTSGIDAALPGLVDGTGFANAAVLSRLQPEAYASASQIGIDTGLALSSAIRTIIHAGTNDRQRLFAVGQGFGTWRHLRGDPSAGVSRATINGNGFLGGIGIASGPLAATAFMGRIYADQRLGTLDARTKADGTFFGGNLALSSGDFNAGGTVIWDDSSADTRRSLYNGDKVTGHYRMRTLSFDGYAGYRFDVGSGGWRVGPRLGITHISVRRGAVSESGGGAFSLNVARQTTEATFLNTDLELVVADTAKMRPWLLAGWRHRVDGDPIVATAAFTGAGSQFTTAGVERGRDFAHIEAGFDWSISRSLRLFAKASSEFDGNLGARDATLGLRWAF